MYGITCTCTVKGEELITAVHTSHPFVIGLDDGWDGDPDVLLLAFVPALHLWKDIFFRK
jgi:hypothetical protein